MITVSNLTYYYGQHLALNNLNFSLEKGQITGFLGPNGAGKSTTLNLISGYLKPTRGTITLGGFNLQENEIEAKSLIGYLPEQPPLYLDHTVEEYLLFIARLKKVTQFQFKTDLEKVYSLLSLGDVRGRLIKNLSKGYRQRVGFAGVLIGNPPLLILDEPTVGLDPNQIIEMRNLIKGLKTDHTLLLSSHILSEIEAVCDRTLIINKGQIVAFDTISQLAKKLKAHHSLKISLLNCEADLLTKLQTIEGILKVENFYTDAEGVTHFTLIAEENNDIRTITYQTLKAYDIDLLELKPNTSTLEELFLQVVGQASLHHR